MQDRKPLGCILLACSALFIALPALAEPPCDCKAYEALDLQSLSLADEVSLIGISALHSEGKAFALQAEELEVLRLKQKIDSSIPWRCRKALQIPRMKLVLRGSINQGALHTSSATSTAPGPLLILNIYDDTLANYPKACIGRTMPGSENPNYVWPEYCYRKSTDYSDSFPRYQKFLDRPDEEVMADMEYITNRAGANNKFTTSQVKVIRVFHNLAQITNEKEFLTRLQKETEKLSAEEKVMVVRMFGQRWEAHGYDHARKDAFNSDTIVDMDQILKTNAENEMQTFDSFDGGRGNPSEITYAKAGVCRDIASAQGKMLETLGFKNTYVVAYATPDGHHATVITQDPTKPNQVIRINYGSMSESTGIQGGQALFQAGAQDVAINYRIFKPGAEFVKDVPSEQGKLFAELAGFDITQLDPLAKANHTVIASNVQLSDRWEGRIFWGRDPQQAQYIGTGATYEYSRSEIAPGRIGGLLATQIRPVNGHFDTEPGTLGVLYVQWEQELNSPKLKIEPLKLEAEIENRAVGLFAVTHMIKGLEQNSTNVQGDLRLQSGLRVKQGGWKSRFSSSYYAGAEITPGSEDIRKGNIGNLGLYRNHLLFTAEGRLRLSKTPEGRAYLVAATQVLADHFGYRGKAELAAVIKDIAVSAAVEGRLTEEAAPYVEGTQRRASAHVNYKANKFVRFDVEGYKSLEEDPLFRGIFGVNGTLTASY